MPTIIMVYDCLYAVLKKMKAVMLLPDLLVEDKVWASKYKKFIYVKTFGVNKELVCEERLKTA